MSQNNETLNVNETPASPEDEQKLMNLLSNEPSDPVRLEGYDVYVVFQRPSFKDKYRHRAWASKKLKEFGYADAETEDPDLAYFIRSWGAVNSHVSKLLYKSEQGDYVIDDEKYAEYTFDQQKELTYESLFEKYTIEEIYNKNYAEDAFVAAGIIAYTKWSDTFTLTGDDIKNS